MKTTYYSTVGTVIPCLDDDSIVYVECAECADLFESTIAPGTFEVTTPCPTCSRIQLVGKPGNAPLRLGYIINR